jgi:hypothetical protein
MSETLTFVHRFSRTLVATMSVSDCPPQPPEMAQINVEWDGKFKKKFLGEYRRWSLFVHQELANRWNARLLYALGTKVNETELWEFTPGQAPKLGKVIPFGIP